MSFFSSLDTEGYDRQYTDRQLVGRMAHYFRPYLGRLIAIILLVLGIGGAGALIPVLVGRTVDGMVGRIEAGQILVLTGLVLLAGVLIWIWNWLRRRLVVRLIGDLILSLRANAFQASAEHDLSFYDRFASGKIVSRITSDTQEFGNTVILMTDLVSDFLQAIILGVVLVTLEWRLALLMFAMLPVIFGATLGFRTLARNATRNGMRAMANVNAMIKESVSGIAVAKNFRQEGAIFAEFDQANRQSYRVNVRRGLILSLVFPSLNALGGVAMALLVFTGGMSAAKGIVSAGTWFLFVQSLDRFLFPVQNLSSFWAQIQSGLSAAERVFALMDAEAEVVQVDHRPAPPLQGDIRFEEVVFRYGEDEKVLNGFNLHIRPGETVALVGHTGAGKSSIAKLIARFYEFQSGRLLIDGQDIRTFDLASYRRQLGIVSQSPFLFSGTVLENIAYANAGAGAFQAAGRAEVEALARQIGDGEWLETLAQGLDTEVGERGGRLSMGQRQLISLMRVLIRKPAIFILDEATASIDPFTEWQIQQALNLILKRSTSILIAHRLSTVKAADRIVVLERGRIIEEGSHETLISRGGHYAGLYNTYFRHQSLDYRPTGLDEFLRQKEEVRANSRQPGDTIEL